MSKLKRLYKKKKGNYIKTKYLVYDEPILCNSYTYKRYHEFFFGEYYQLKVVDFPSIKDNEILYISEYIEKYGNPYLQKNYKELSEKQFIDNVKVINVPDFYTTYSIDNKEYGIRLSNGYCKHYCIGIAETAFDISFDGKYCVVDELELFFNQKYIDIYIDNFIETETARIKEENKLESELIKEIKKLESEQRKSNEIKKKLFNEI